MTLDDIEKLIAAATPAPWEYIERDYYNFWSNHADNQQNQQ